MFHFFSGCCSFFFFFFSPDQVDELSETKLCFLQFEMRVPQMCKVLCRRVLNEKTAKDFKEKIEDEYRVNM